MTDRPLLSRGSYGNAVAYAQKLLTGRGYDVGPVDKAFGQRTERAVIRFQAHRGLHVDGQVGPRTWAALEHHAEHKPPQKLTEAERFARVVKQRVTGRDGHPRPGYRLGAEITISQKYPGLLDCSETVQFGLGQTVNDLWIDGSYNQARAVKPLTVEKARGTIGSLVFLTTNNRPDGVVHHVGVVCTEQGRPMVAQARSAYLEPECGVWDFDSQDWILAGTVPILEYKR